MGAKWGRVIVGVVAAAVVAVMLLVVGIQLLLILAYWQFYPLSYDVSPSGKIVVFTANGTGGRDIYALDLGTRQMRPLSPSPQFETEVRFLTDETIVVSAAEDQRKPYSPQNLYVVNLQDGTRRRLTTGNWWYSDIMPLASDEILVTRLEIRKRFDPVKGMIFGGIIRVYGLVEGVYKLDMRTGSLQPVGTDSLTMRCAESLLFKDGRHVIMENQGSVPYLDLVTLNAPVGTPGLRQADKRRLARNAHTPALSPDEQYVYYVQENDESERAIMRMNLKTGSTDRLTVRSLPVSALRASDKSLFFLEGSDNDPTLWRVDLRTKKVEKILTPGQFANPTLR